jgi:catechol 2,3-dioxygenase-like lactoylglutathione lyase family enzyme
VPVADIDAALAFYRDGVGFVLDHDVRPGGDARFVQLTPPGSGCSIVLGASSMAPGSLRGLQLVVGDLDAARASLVERGVEVSEIRVLGPAERDGARFAFFSDPDGNTWAIQELRSRR